MTPREALLAIRHEIASGQYRGFMAGIDKLASEGLDVSGPATFELTDQLADRLAEAHNLLRGIVEGIESGVAKGNDFFSEEFKAKFYEALALPPDLEAMVERRIGVG